MELVKHLYYYLLGNHQCSFQSYIILFLAFCLTVFRVKCCQIRQLEYAQGFLIIFLIIQTTGFVYAILYPVRNSSQYPFISEAIHDYDQKYNEGFYETESDKEYNEKHRNEDVQKKEHNKNGIQYSFYMKDICQDLRRLYGEFQYKSYAKYCEDMIQGIIQQDTLSHMNSLQKGLLIYYCAGELSSVFLTYCLFRMTLANYRRLSPNSNPRPSIVPNTTEEFTVKKQTGKNQSKNKYAYI